MFIVALNAELVHESKENDVVKDIKFTNALHQQYIVQPARRKNGKYCPENYYYDKYISKCRLGIIED